MKIVVIGDIHMATLDSSLAEGLHKADLVLINGDLTNYGGKREARWVLDEIMRFNARVLAQFGNLDRAEVNRYLEELGINPHGQARLVDGTVCLIGVGGSNPTPFHTPSEFSERQLLALGEEAFAQGREDVRMGKSMYRRNIPTILVTHAPPLFTKVDVIHNGEHVGSRAIRTIIERHRPDLCIAGHIHEAKGIDMIDRTAVCNPGMVRRGGCVTITINANHIEYHLQ